MPPAAQTPESSGIAADSGTGARAHSRERRRRSFIRDYSYVRAEVRAILLMDALMIAVITVVALVIR